MSSTTIFEKYLEKKKERLIDESKRNKLIYFSIPENNLKSPNKPVELFNLDELALQNLIEGNNNLFMDTILTDIEKNNLENIDDYINNRVEYINELRKQEIDKFLFYKKVIDYKNRVLESHRKQDNLSENETGVNILFLAYGFLHWKEAIHSEIENISPLFLIPIDINKSTGPIKSYNVIFDDDEDIVFNPSLRLIASKMFNIKFEKIPEVINFDNQNNFNEYFEIANKEIQENKDWYIDKRIFLARFNFQKLSLYREIDQYKKEYIDHKIINSLISKKRYTYNNSQKIEELDKISPIKMFHVLDCDSSQLKCAS